jgi:hypothetical protein
MWVLSYRPCDTWLGFTQRATHMSKRRETLNQQTLREMYLELQQLRKLLEQADTRQVIDALAVLERYDL